MSNYRRLKVGLIGIGSIGSYLAKSLRDRLVWVCDLDEKKARQKIKEFRLKANFVTRPQGNVNLVIEAASQTAVECLPEALRFADVLILSVGALQNEKLFKRLLDAGEKHRHKIYLSSGAIGGLDVIKSIRKDLEEIVLETRKNPKSFGRDDKEETLLFEGNAGEAVNKFPMNINVAGTLALAGMGFRKTKVRIISDPSAQENTHRITAKSKAGNYQFTFENKTFPDNPKTSLLAAKAALRMVNEIESHLKIG